VGIEKAINAISVGLGYGWIPKHRIKEQLDNQQLKTLKLQSGSSYSTSLYLIQANKLNPGPGTRQLASIIRSKLEKNRCKNRYHAKNEIFYLYSIADTKSPK
jgi:DNA-binding transcriptional LysR family regulator